LIAAQPGIGLTAERLGDTRSSAYRPMVMAAGHITVDPGQRESYDIADIRPLSRKGRA
jgi:hypothetical protein